MRDHNATEGDTLKRSIVSQIERLRSMTVAELRNEWARLYDEQTRSRNRDYLWRRLAWRVQELARGGLSDNVQQCLTNVAPDVFPRARTPTAPVANEPSKPKAVVRDLRMPPVGSVLNKHYKGRDLRVVVRDDGFEYDGEMYTSLTAVAKAVTGSRSINGRLFFGLTSRKR